MAYIHNLGFFLLVFSQWRMSILQNHEVKLNFWNGSRQQFGSIGVSVVWVNIFSNRRESNIRANTPSRLVKIVLLDIDTIFKNNFDHYLFAIKNL